jgi:hypothetical protein
MFRPTASGVPNIDRDGEMVKTAIQALMAAVGGAALVWTLFWLVESVLPDFTYAPWEAERLLIVVAGLVTAGLIARNGSMLTAAALLTGAGLAWSSHEMYSLSLCQSDAALYRPCTTSEVAWMVVPPIVLLLIAAAIVANVAFGKAGRYRAS